MSKLRIASELKEHDLSLSLSHEQRTEAAEIMRDLVVRILDKAAENAGRRVADGNFADFVEPFSYIKGYEEALNYLDAAISGGRDFQERADWQERMAKLRGDVSPTETADDDELWEEDNDDDIEWED